MAYTAKSPLAEDDIVQGEQEIVRSIGKQGHMGRMPAFAALAKATGGLYVENTDSGMSVDEAMTKAGLDFTVESVKGVSVSVIGDNGVTTVEHPDYQMNVARHADGRITPVGMTRKRYEIVQSRQAFAFGQTLIGDFGANVAAAGQYGKPLGSKTYLALALEPFVVGGVDKYQMNLTVLNSFDGLSGLVGVIAPLRLDCTNQVTATFGRGASQRISLRHTKTVEQRADEARYVLGLTETWEANFQKAADVLLSQPMTAGQFAGFVEKNLWRKPAKDATKRATTMHETRMEGMLALFNNAATNEFGRGTRYAAYNSVTEYLDWYTPVRGEDKEVARYTRTLDGRSDEMKDKVFRSLIPETARKELSLA